MKNLICIVCISLALTACKEKKEENVKNPDQEIATEKLNESKTYDLELGCYEYNANGNKTRMEVQKIKGDSIIAKLIYAYAEKDRNEGVFQGTHKGNILFGTYNFVSEGKESKREVIFKIEDNQLIEGFGDLNEKGTKFRDKTQITYSATTPWKKINCKS